MISLDPIALDLGKEAARDLLRPPPGDMLERPLDYILAGNMRQRAASTLLARLAEQRRGERDEVDLIQSYLARDLVLHEADKSGDLYPVLARRAHAEDEIGGMLASLGRAVATEPVIAAMARALSSDPPAAEIAFDAECCDLMRLYAACSRNRIAVENNIVLVLARARLTKRDLAALTGSMRKRRERLHHVPHA
jgi:hypothetical protein